MLMRGRPLAMHVETVDTAPGVTLSCRARQHGACSGELWRGRSKYTAHAWGFTAGALLSHYPCMQGLSLSRCWRVYLEGASRHSVVPVVLGAGGGLLRRVMELRVEDELPQQLCRAALVLLLLLLSLFSLQSPKLFLRAISLPQAEDSRAFDRGASQ